MANDPPVQYRGPYQPTGNEPGATSTDTSGPFGLTPDQVAQAQGGSRKSKKQKAAEKSKKALGASIAAQGPDPTAHNDVHQTADPFTGIFVDRGGNPFSVVSTYQNFVATTHDPDAVQPHFGLQNASDYAGEHLGNLDQSQIKALQKQLADGGFLQKGHDTGLMDQDTVNAYANLLGNTSVANTEGRVITPEDYLAERIKALQKQQNKDQTKTSTSVTVHSADDARALAYSTFRNALGRAPGQHELSAFEAALQSYDRSHPSITNSTTTLDSQGNQKTSSSTTSGGGNADQFARDYVSQHQGSEQHSYQAGTAYFQAALDVLRGDPGFSSTPIDTVGNGGP